MAGAGILVQIINIDALAAYLGGLKEIVIADVTTTQAIVATLICLALMLLPYYGPVLVYVAAPGRAGPLLRRMTAWMLTNSRMLEIVVGLAFGALFLWKGLAVLL